MQNPSLGLSYAQVRFNKAIAELRKERVYYPASASIQSIHRGEVHSYGMYLAASIDANYPATPEFYEVRSRLWAELDAANDEWTREMKASVGRDHPPGMDPGVERAAVRIDDAWIALTTPPA